MKLSTPLKALAIGSAAYAAASGLVFYELMGRNAKIPTLAFQMSIKDVEPGIADDDERVVWFYNQNFEEFELINADGARLKAYYLPAAEKSDKFLVCSHGYRSNGKAEFRFAGKFLHDSGFNLFIVDHRAAGESEGQYITFGCKEAEDLLLWVKFVNEKFGEDIQIGLYGVSMGCATITTLCGCEDLPDNVKFAAADCGYTSAKDEFSYNLQKVHIPDFVIMNSVDFLNRKISGCSLDDMNPLRAVAKSKVPILFIHGAKDDFVPVAMAQVLYDACPTEKELFIAEGAAHAESYQRQTEEYEKRFTEFSERFMKATVKE